ncbi:glycogen debranching protein GlgX [Parafrigoribacterium mesophilum]|uniref:glycogen debranching protein GlgX n=1 Tax=Parafrigoribacterium mesophilum TaxID=433646 RepID=UPI0031FBCC89
MPSVDPLRDLGVRSTAEGGTIRVASNTASSIELCLFDPKDLTWVTDRIPLSRDGDGVWTASSPKLLPDARYTLRADGPAAPANRFDPALHLLDPYARGLSRTATGQWRSCVVDGSFDWGGVVKPATPLDKTVIYETHPKGLTKLNPAVPEEFRGTYAGLAHDTAIRYLKDLGVTAVELLPVHQFVTEPRLAKQGLVNYWGYNTLAFFSPHGAYASNTAQAAGPAQVLREFKGMVRLLHEAGLEVILDVVYNHTAELGVDGPTTSLRGLDNATYYRHSADGRYIDVTGCGNTVNFALDIPQRLLLDSLRYWANDVQIDGFRFDLAAALGRDENVNYRRDHPLLESIVNDPELAAVKMIAEPWDVGAGGWQVGNFPPKFSEWNDDYRDRVRDFWLTDIAAARQSGSAPNGSGAFATKLSGSSNVFDAERGPLASVNFITAHDGFTAFDLTAYNQKHNLGNGENNRDGTDNNHSFNHGVEGHTDDPAISAVRRKALRNLLGTLLLSAGVPMLTAGDEVGRSQKGNNNAYCHDNPLTWLPWELEDWQSDLWRVVQELLRLRRENPALRPARYAVRGENVASASRMEWFNAAGESMSIDDWNSSSERTLQYFAESTPESEGLNRILLIVHGLETPETVTLPSPEGIGQYTLLWNSALDDVEVMDHPPGVTVNVAGTSLQLFRAH